MDLLEYDEKTLEKISWDLGCAITTIKNNIYQLELQLKEQNGWLSAYQNMNNSIDRTLSNVKDAKAKQQEQNNG